MEVSHELVQRFNFNVASCEIVFDGVSAHPMSAKGKLINPILMAQDFISHFDRMDTPEHTSGREGFFWITDLVANDSNATMQILIRDFDSSSSDRRKQKIEAIAEIVERKYPSGGLRYRMKDTYRNFGTYLSQDPRAAFAVLST